MTWAILGILTIALAITLVMVVRLTVTVSRTSANALASLITFDQRAQEERKAHREQTRGLIDRIITGDVETVRGFEAADDADEGGFLTPEEQRELDEDEEEGGQELPYRGWGNASPMRDRLDALAEVDALATEDDLDGFDADRERRLAQAREHGVVP